MKRFVIYRDFKANEGPACGYTYETIEAADILEAIEIADRMFSERLYLMRIMSKTGKIEKDACGWNKETYEAVLCRRSYGWHKNTEKNSEIKHLVERHFKKDLEFFDNKSWG